MIKTIIGLSLIYALLMKYCKNLSYPKFLPTSTLTIFTILVNQHIAQVTALKQLVKVINDLFLFPNKGNISALALLDFSSAFDTIDHSILVHCLHTDLCFTDAVLQWFSSYLTDRTHYFLYLIIVLPLLLYTQVLLRVQFLALHFSPCTLSLCLPLSTHTLSYTINLLTTHNYRCLLPLMRYPSYYTLCSRVYMMSNLWQLRT